MGKSATERLTFQPSALPRTPRDIVNHSSINDEKVQSILTYDQATSVLGNRVTNTKVCRRSTAVTGQPCESDSAGKGNDRCHAIG